LARLKSPVHVVCQPVGKDLAESVETGQANITFDASRMKDEPRDEDGELLVFDDFWGGACGLKICRRGTSAEASVILVVDKVGVGLNFCGPVVDNSTEPKVVRLECIT
jgi:hypothetical protein